MEYVHVRDHYIGLEWKLNPSYVSRGLNWILLANTLFVAVCSYLNPVVCLFVCLFTIPPKQHYLSAHYI